MLGHKHGALVTKAMLTCCQKEQQQPDGKVISFEGSLLQTKVPETFETEM